MPGICGILGQGSPSERERKLRIMRESMTMEPFYASGEWSDPGRGIALAWTGHGGCFTQQMPVWNASGDCGLVFCGEHFPRSQENAGANGGARHDPGSVAVSLLERYEEAGKEFLTGLNGWFCGVVLDLRQGAILLFNDRYGVSRVFYLETAEGFFFSSETRALLAVHPQTRALDPQGLGEYLSCGCVLQDRTLFPGIRSLPCAASWEFRRGQPVRKGAYFSAAAWEQQDKLGTHEFYEELRSAWKAIVPRYLQSDGPVGLSLTGGVDSRMILAWTHPEPGDLPSYTFCGDVRESNDVKLARRLAELYGQSHRVLCIDDGFFSGFGDLAERTIRISGGAMDVTGTLDLYLQRGAREISPVRLSGVYGGEILRKLVAFKPMPVSRSIWAQEAADSMALAATTYAGERNSHPVSFSAFKQAPWHMTSKFAIERSQVTFRTPFFDNELVQLVYRAPDEAMSSNAVSLRLVGEGNPALEGIETDRGVTGNGSKPGEKARHLMQQFLFKAEYAYDYGMPQWLARVDHALAPLHLERLFLGRHGPSHFRVWYRDRLADYVRDVLLDARSLQRPYVNGEKVRALVQSHLDGSGNFTLEIHKLLSLELIQRELLKSA